MATEVGPDETAAAQAVFPPRAILVPVDFGESSLAGLEAARILAGRFGSGLELLHVDRGPSAALSQGAESDSDHDDLAAYYRDLRARFGVLESALRPAASRVMDGDPFDVIPRLAAGGAADMLCMGTHGRGGIRRLTVGSVAEAVVHKSRVPVLTTRRQPHGGWPSSILVPMKWTSYADRALLLAQQWALRLGASLAVLHVFESDEPEQPVADSLREHVQRLLGERGPRPDWITRRGRPFVETLRAAEAGRFDMIALTAHTHGFWPDAFLGTTAERVLRYSPVAVLSVPSA